MTTNNESATGDSDDAKNTSHDSPWWKRIDWHLVIQVLLFAVGIKVALIYSGQLEQMKEATVAAKSAADTAQQSLIAANRSWIEATMAPPWTQDANRIKSNIGKMTDITFPVTITNIGKIPVIKVEIESAVEILNNSDAPTFEYGGRHNVLHAHILYPGSSAELDDALYDKTSILGRPAVYVQMTKELRHQLETGQKYIAVEGRGAFGDGLETYSFQYCFWILLATGPQYTYNAARCADYNLIVPKK